MKRTEMIEKMVKLEKEIEELKEEFQNSLEPEVGYKDDKLFLLSTEEYEKYKDIIPNFCWWWLRSPGDNCNSAACVDFGGLVFCDGLFVLNDCCCVRPALKINHSLEIGEKLYALGCAWIVIDTNLAICETAIAMRGFDKKSNDYETSEIRKFLLDWYEERMRNEN